MGEVELRIARGGGRESIFRIEAGPEETILDLLERLRTTRDSTLLYRHSCHHGSCGTCSCLVNGVEKLACLTKALGLGTEVIRLEPLRSVRVLGDLAYDPEAIFRDIPSKARYVRPSGWNTDAAVPAESLAGSIPEEDRMKGGFERFENCIECGSCVSACPVASPFMGPAALAAVNREIEKGSPDSGLLFARASLPDGAGACERHLACSRVCPQAVYPAKHIQLIRNRLAKS
jgi:succinate dehydrogenase/fumarate reductase iron-sulfur protein